MGHSSLVCSGHKRERERERERERDFLSTHRVHVKIIMRVFIKKDTYARVHSAYSLIDLYKGFSFVCSGGGGSLGRGSGV